MVSPIVNVFLSLNVSTTSSLTIIHQNFSDNPVEFHLHLQWSLHQIFR
jgi:hypothetical protein